MEYLKSKKDTIKNDIKNNLKLNFNKEFIAYSDGYGKPLNYLQTPDLEKTQSNLKLAFNGNTQAFNKVVTNKAKVNQELKTKIPEVAPIIPTKPVNKENMELVNKENTEPVNMEPVNKENPEPVDSGLVNLEPKDPRYEVD